MNAQLITAASVLGAVCVSAGHAGAANLVWSISNPLLVLHNVRLGDMAQARMFGVFTILAFAGVLRGIIV